MNKANNKRRRESQMRIERAFVNAIQTKELNEIFVTDICKEANVNRTTFYANYIDIYDLADKIKKHLGNEVANIFSEEEKEQGNTQENFLKLFTHIKENPIFYKIYFKLDTDSTFQVTENMVKEAAQYFKKSGYEKYLDYHVEFFRNGLNAVIKKWLAGGCKETPQEISEIFVREYSRY